MLQTFYATYNYNIFLSNFFIFYLLKIGPFWRLRNFWAFLQPHTSLVLFKQKTKTMLSLQHGNKDKNDK